jgi:hypothetical protein
MDYNDFLGINKEPTEEHKELIEARKILNSKESEYEFARFGLPSGALNFEKEQKGRTLLKEHFISSGYTTWPSSKLNNNLKKHVALFRCHLDLWDKLCPNGSMSKEEIYYRCITEGASFADWVKKARSTSFRAATSETDTSIDEDYLLTNYNGYNSIIHERYLINWDSSDETDDIKYAFIEPPKIDEERFRIRVKKLFQDFRIHEEEFPEEFDMIGAMKASVMHDPKKKKNLLMRSFWSDEIDPHRPYYATRRVVPIEAGNVRDTGVGCPSTILKVKQLNALARVISEKLPYCANAPENICNQRLRRVLKRNTFLHLDFKKFGLTFPRALTNIVIEEIGRVSGIDTEHLQIKNFFVEIDGEVYSTSSGSMLGWMDPINCIAVCAILHWLSREEELGFDFISFNDDVEISKFSKKDPTGTLELLRLAIITEIDSFGIPISLDKTFGSKCSVFLERYAYYNQYDIDMYKEQLTVKAYAQSLVTKFPWQAKMFHAAAEMWTKSDYATDRCIETCPVEFRTTEATTSLWSGGWFIPRKDKQDYSLVETDELGYLLGLELAKFKTRTYSTRIEEASTQDEIDKCIVGKTMNAYSPELWRLTREEGITLSEINSDIDLIREGLQTFLFKYEGREEFALRVSWIAERNLERNHIDNGG